MLLPKQGPAITRQILAKRPMKTSTLPELDDLLDDSQNVEIYPWRATFDEVKDEPCMILHTSGSTGTPKPVYVTHGNYASNDAHQLIPSAGGKPTMVDLVRGKRLFLAFPLFHAANLTWTVGYSIFSGMTCVLPPPGPLTVDIVDMVHTYGKVDGSLLPPSILIDLYNNPPCLSNMVNRLKFVAYVGGTLPVEIGDSIAARMKLITFMGSTETMLLPIEDNDDPKDWRYIPLSPYLGHTFRPARDGLHELVIIRQKKFELFQGAFSTFPGLEEYPMKDLYEQHPLKSSSWAFRARADDIIALNNAEKVNPVTMETVISGHPAVAGAIIGGDGEFQTSLLVEPRTAVSTEHERAELLPELWPTIKDANRDCPAHGRIMKDFVIFTDPEKPLPRAGKETVQRHAALKLYAPEMKALYKKGEPSPTAAKETTVDDGSSSNGTLVPSDEEAPPPRSQNDSLPSDHTSKHNPAGDYKHGDDVVTLTSAELDARIESALRRILPSAMQTHLGPVFLQVMNDMFTASSKQTNSHSPMDCHDPSPDVSSTKEKLHTSTAPEDHAPKTSTVLCPHDGTQ